VQGQLPVVHPVIDHDYVFNSPIFGGELSFHNNLISLNRDEANFDAISKPALVGGLCAQTADPALINKTNCVLRGVPGDYTRASTEWSWKTTIIDSYGQMFTPFASVRADAADMNIANQPGVANFINTGQSDIGRVMPVAGLEYRYPLINVQSWGTQTIEPIGQLILRPNETFVGSFPNEDAQSLIYDDSNLFKVNKFSGWDRVEGGGRVNAGIQYTAQFNRGGNVNFLFGQSYQIYGLNSFALPSTTNTGLNSGLDTAASELRGARVLPAERRADLHLALPLLRDRFHPAAHRTRNGCVVWPLDDDDHVRQLRGPAADRIPGPPRGHSRHSPLQSRPELGPAGRSGV